ncbi:MAG: hypothetical protein LBR56_04685 [Sporomusaceae bacterium]|nr:hypothetical protein [Sporomusaceae bacterium]
MKKQIILITACLFLLTFISFAAQPLPDATSSENYTGVVIVAKDMGLKPTFSPLIYDEAGNIVYGDKNIDPDFAIKQGMVEYNSLEVALSGNSRAGAKPLVVNALKVSDNNYSPVISNDDAQKIAAANAQNEFLAKCAVVFARE